MSKIELGLVASGSAGRRTVRERWERDLIPGRLKPFARALRDHAAPICAMPIDAITLEYVPAILKPIWTTRPETARKSRGRIERVLDAAKAAGHRKAKNPAR